MNVVKLRPELESLQDTADEINRQFEEARKHQLKADDARQLEEYSRQYAGKLLIQAKARVESGTETDLKWQAWCRKHIDRSQGDIRKVIKLATLDDVAVGKERSDTRGRMSKLRKERAHNEDVRAPFSQKDQAVVEAALDLIGEMTPEQFNRFVEQFRSKYHAV